MNRRFIDTLDACLDTLICFYRCAYNMCLLLLLRHIVSFHYVWKNIDTILSKQVDKVILSAGVNDLIVGYEINAVVENLNKLVSKFYDLI